ncbi:MAG: DUF2437 domain-containing protein [Kordiimonadaceae bacterium]|nr:DUF2437 domain-containing protein [Kordiimonadaceae bacterium]
MKFNFNKMIAVLLLIGLLPSVALSDTYVRYEQDGKTSWGELKGDMIHQLSDAPYLNGEATGKTVKRTAVKMMAPVDPKDVYMTGFNYENHIQLAQKELLLGYNKALHFLLVSHGTHLSNP